VPVAGVRVVEFGYNYDDDDDDDAAADGGGRHRNEHSNRKTNETEHRKVL